MTAHDPLDDPDLAPQSAVDDSGGQPALRQRRALEVGPQIAGVAAAVGGQAGRDLMRSDDDGARVRAALDDAADERGNGETPLGVHRVERAALEEVVDLHRPRPLLYTDLPRSRTHEVRRVTRRSAGKVPQKSEAGG